MPSILSANTLSSGFDVSNSLRFNSASNDHLNRTQTGGNRRKFTFSTWVKRCNPATRMSLFLANRSGSNYNQFFLHEDGFLEADFYHSGTQIFRYKTDALYRDPSAWYHMVMAVDTEHDTAGSRVRIYVNGLEVTSFSTETNPSEDVDTHVNENSIVAYIGSDYNSNEPDYYLAETVMLDGTQATPTDFGEFNSDSGIWKPIDVSGLTFGTNGFYLQYKETGTSANASGIGADTSGETNHFTVQNLTAVDQSTDTCTNNFATLNPLDNYYSGATLSEGNLLQVTDTHSGSSSGESSPVISTIGVSSGKWYSEIKFVSTTSHNYGRPGVTSNQTGPGDGTSVLGHLAGSWGYFFNSGSIYNGNGTANVSYGTTTDVGDIIGIYLDLDNNKLYFSDNGSLVSATGISITDPASTNLGAYFFGASDESRASATFGWNFGGCSAFAISSAVQDDNGYGNFEYSPNITGDSEAKKFYSLCTKNLAEFG